jgi:hypothetical protein
MKQIDIKSMKKSRKIGLLAGVFFAATTLLAGTAYAATSSVILTGGTLSISAPVVGNFTTVVLDGTAKTTPATMGAFTVYDARGTGAGWNVTVQASQFTTGTKTLAYGSLSMPNQTVTKIDSTSNTAPTVVAGSYLIDSASALKISSAAVDTGMGSYSYSGGNLTLSIPANAYAGTYTSTVTVSVVTGP